MIDGWDNAPVVDVSRGALPKAITLILPYYENPMFLARQVYGWSCLPKELRAHLSVIIVDDGSPDHPAETVLVAGRAYKSFSLRLFRLDTDVRWNWLAARNIAMHHAQGWCVGTDMDHVLPPDTFDALIFGNHDENKIYRFSRAEHTGQEIHCHPNSWFMTRDMFWKFGGYDEALSGYYGTDGEARRRWVKTAPVETLKSKLIRWERYGDSSTLRYKRKEGIDIRAQQLIKERGKDWKPKTLSFPFHEVSL